MKKLVFVSCVAALSVMAAIFFVSHNNSAAITGAGSPYTCQANGTFSSLDHAVAGVTADDSARSAQALTWLKSQLLTTTPITSPSTLTPSSEYPSNYTGPIDGTFTLRGASYQTKNDAPLFISSPSSVSSDYTGAVHGGITVTPTAWRWIIQVYKKTQNGYVQVPRQALADTTTGEFTIDLSDLTNTPEGEWAFGLLDAENSYAPYGSQWPALDYYDALEVQQKLVTDAVYDWSSTRANADGTFHFDNSNTGKKLFRLVDTSTGAVLAEYAQKTGLIRSYKLDSIDPAAGTSFENRSFVYDQALALFAAVSAQNETLATTLVDGLLTLQETSGSHAGGFVFAAPQLTPEFRDPLIRTGAHAIATDALLAYLQHYPDAQKAATYRSHAVAALDFLETTRSSTEPTSGLYLGGYGDYSGPGNSFNDSATISWASTEHNIDAWHLLMRAGNVLGNRTVNYAQKARTLHGSIQQKLYNSAEERLNQGMTAGGPDEANPLDVNSWGAIQLYAGGEREKAHKAMEQLPLFSFTRSGVTGYAPFYDSPGYPNAAPNVWFEGSFGVALALLRLGDEAGYRALINELKPAQQNDGSFVYATDPDPTYEIIDRKAVASTAWYIIATTGRDVIWNSCNYTPQDEVSATPPAVTQKPSSGTPRALQPATQLSDISADRITLASPSIADSERPASTAPQSSPDAQYQAAQEEKSTAPSIPWGVPAGITALLATLAGAWLVVRRRNST